MQKDTRAMRWIDTERGDVLEWDGISDHMIIKWHEGTTHKFQRITPFQIKNHIASYPYIRMEPFKDYTKLL